MLCTDTCDLYDIQNFTSVHLGLGDTKTFNNYDSNIQVTRYYYNINLATVTVQVLKL